VVVIKGKDTVRNIIVVIKDRTGSGSISGTLTYTGVVPANADIIVAAVPVDTTLPDSLRLSDQAFMMAYTVKLTSIGTYSISGLPNQVYYVVSVIESGDQTRRIEHALGVYGQVIPDTTLEFPFKPTAVVVAGSPVTGISITLIKSRVSTVPIAAGRSPKAFGMDQPVFVRSTGVARISYAVPVSTAVIIRIMDMAGKTVASLNQGVRNTGRYYLEWNARSCANGLYICRMEAGAFVAHRAMMIVR
jgi:hypothetical protein